MSPLVVRRRSCRVAAGGEDASVLWSAVSIQGLKEDSPDHAMALAVSNAICLPHHYIDGDRMLIGRSRLLWMHPLPTPLSRL
jgi:hypothetical protein